nr:hypothetical protein [Tanacetum cinerariifolium]
MIKSSRLHITETTVRRANRNTTRSKVDKRRLHTSYLCEYVNLYYIELGAADAGPTRTWGDRFVFQFLDVAYSLAYIMLEMDEDTVVRKPSVRPNGFACYPFQLVEFDSLEPTNNKYLIDVVGYVTNVGRTTITRSGSKTLDFHLANNRLCPLGQSVRVTMWGGLGEMLIEKRTRHVELYLIVLIAMSVKLYNNRLYLFSTSSTMIVDDEQTPVLKQFKSDDSGIELAKELLPADSTCEKAETLKNLLTWARNQKYDAATFHCSVRIDKIRTKKGWNYPLCSGEKCKKGNLDRKQGRFWCDSSHSSVDYPVLSIPSTDTGLSLRFQMTLPRRLLSCEEETGLPPALANIVGTLHTLELKSNSYCEHANYESFTCWRVVLEEALDESGSSRIGCRWQP